MCCQNNRFAFVCVLRSDYGTSMPKYVILISAIQFVCIKDCFGADIRD